MNNITTGAERAVILWLSGLRLADICALTEVKLLLDRGALIKLDPLPITGSRTQHYQVMSGRQPGGFGFFDTLVVQGYSVIEEPTVGDTDQKLLSDLLKAAGWEFRYEETNVSELASCLSHAISSMSASSSCLIAKCTIQGNIGEADASNIVQALRTARTCMGETGLLALLSDTQPAVAYHFVNINNFLAEIGVIEYNEQTGWIDWSNSLAYYVGHGQLWVNQLGREQQGIVHPQNEYEEVRDTLITMLSTKCRNAETGELVIERIYRKEDIYPNDYLFCAPDLVVLFKPGYAPSPNSTRLKFDEAVLTAPLSGKITTAGIHPSVLTGFLIASSYAFAQGISVSEHAPLTAVAPTLLHALGVKHSAMDGSVISQLFSPSYLKVHPIQASEQGQDLSEEDEEIVIGRLRDLGYI